MNTDTVAKAIDALAKAIASVAEHRTFFFTVTAIMAVFVAVGAWWLWKRALVGERWVLYFSLGFLCFAVQYAPPSLIWILGTAWPAADNFVPELIVDQIRVLASAFNNLFLLGAAVSLQWPKFQPKRLHWLMVFLIGFATVLWDWLNLFHPWHRVPDAIFSAATLGLLGFAFFTNISPRRKRRLAVIALGGAGLYALLNVLFALSPPLTEGDLCPNFRDKLVGYLLETGVLRPADPRFETARRAVDTSLIAFAFILKFLLAGGGFALIMRVLVLLSPRALSGVLAEVSRGEGSFFSSRGIVRAVGESFRCDTVSLCYRMPGLNEPKVAWWRWEREKVTKLKREHADLQPLSSAKEDREGYVLATGIRVESPHYGAESLSWWRRLIDSGATSLLIVPIRYHGCVTGCLSLEWQTPYAFTETAIHHAERLAELLSSAVEARRRLAALWRWGPRVKESKILTPPSGYSDIIKTFAEVLCENLGVLAVGLSIRAGFDPEWGTYGPNGYIGGRQRDEHGSRLNRLRRLQDPYTRSHKELRTVLTVRNYRIGLLQILLPSPRDIAIPVVALDEQSLRAFGELISTAILDAVESGLSARLSRLQNDFLVPENQVTERWFSVVKDRAEEAGIRWVVATPRTTGSPLGERGPVSLVLRHADTNLRPREIGHIRLASPEYGVHHLLRLPLNTSQYDLWIGIANPFFGPELNDSWPWRKFLERLAQAADAALSHFKDDQELSKLRRKTDQFRGLLKASEDAATFIHEIRNIARNFQFSAQSLEDARRRKLLHGPDDIEADIVAMLESAGRLYQLADGLMRPSALDDKAAYPLVDLVEEVEQLFRPLLNSRHVRLETRMDRGLLVSTPSYTVHLALVTLVSNSLDAIHDAKKGSTVWIEAEDGDELVACLVRDDGPGISPSVRDRLFEPGASTKDGTGGKGLFLARSRLQEAKGDMVLTESSSSGATFTIHLRKPTRKESRYGEEFGADRRGRGPSAAAS